MKIAIFSDIHANIYAFKAALEDAIKCDVTDYFFMGDLITDLPWANEVYDIVRSLKNVKIIRGNRERTLLDLCDSGILKGYHQIASIYWTYEELSEINKDYIRGLPDSLSFEVNGTYFHLNHCPADIWGQKVSDELHYFANSGDSHEYYTDIMTRTVFNNADAIKKRQGIYIYGHFHGQWHCRMGDTIIINPGACGLAGDNESRAEYSILSYQNGNWIVDERLIEYNRQDAIRKLRSSGIYEASPIWSEAIAMTLETGRENLHLLFEQLGNSGVKPDDFYPYFAYTNDIWDIVGQGWVDTYKQRILNHNTAFQE